MNKFLLLTLLIAGIGTAYAQPMPSLSRMVKPTLPEAMRTPIKAPQNSVYHNNFDSYDDFDQCTILDKNNDGLCWDWMTYAGQSFAYCYGTDSQLTANDWLITPPVSLQAGHSYKFEVETQALGSTIEKFEARFGTGYHVEDLTMPAIPPTVLGETTDQAVTVTGQRIDISQNGDYRFAYHLMSDPYTSGVAVLSMSVIDLGESTSDEPVLLYSETFESAASFIPYNIYDVNGDGATWSHNATEKCAQYTYSSVNNADDWLITPALPMRVGRDYKLSFRCRTLSETEKLEVRIGTGDKPADQTTVLVETLNLSKRDDRVVTVPLFTVDHTQDYHISFHAVSDHDCHKIYVDDIEIYDIGANGQTEDPGEKPEPQGLPVPYSVDMTDPAVFATYDVFDANYDGRTWRYSPIINCTFYGFSPERNADDWLFSPEIALKAGKIYRLTVTAASRGLEFPERFEARLGTGTAPDQYTIAAIDPTEIVMNVGDPAIRYHSNRLSVENDGAYKIGIHAISDANMSDLLVHHIDLEEVFADAPQAVTALTAEPDPTGLLQATISFTAPTHDFAEHLLSAPLSHIEVLRNGVMIRTFSDVQPGTDISFVDDGEGIVEGTNQYTVVPYVGDHAGDSAQVNIFVGSDVPQRVPSLSATDQGESILLQWEEVARTGVNGGTVYPAHVKYNIYEAIPVYDLGVMIDIRFNYIQTAEGLQTIISHPELNRGAHEPIHYAVCPVNSAGEGKASYANLMKGAPYALPFKESFPAISVNSYLAVDTDCAGQESGLYLSENASDNDGGALAFVSYEPDRYVAVFTGKIDMTKGEQPKLIFDARNAIGNNTLVVQTMTPNGERQDLMQYVPGADYTTQEIDLSAYAGLLWVRLVFATEFPIYVNPDDGNELNLDNIRVEAKMDGVQQTVWNHDIFPCDVYSPDGTLLRAGARNLEGLSGVVIANGHKYILR